MVPGPAGAERAGPSWWVRPLQGQFRWPPCRWGAATPTHGYRRGSPSGCGQDTPGCKKVRCARGHPNGRISIDKLGNAAMLAREYRPSSGIGDAPWVTMDLLHEASVVASCSRPGATAGGIWGGLEVNKTDPDIPNLSANRNIARKRFRISRKLCLNRANMDTIAKSKWKELLALAKAGGAEAQWEVGYYYESGAVDKSGNILAKTNPLKAHRWYKLSAEQGNSTAQVALSNLLSTGDGMDRDYESAVSWAKQAIAQGSSSGAFNLGTIYRDQGKPGMAFRCYRRAASLGDNDALLQVGLCHLFGIGTRQDFGAAYRALSKIIAGKPSASCDRTKENALYWMSVIHLLGKGTTKKSLACARRMLELANVDHDHEQANEILNIIGKSKYLSA